jgi:type I restriction enzyme, S subunit
MTTFRELVERGILAVGDGYRAKNEELGGDRPIFLRSAYLQDSRWELEKPDRFVVRSPAAFGDKVARLLDTVLTTKGNSLGRGIGLLAASFVLAITSVQ